MTWRQEWEEPQKRRLGFGGDGVAPLTRALVIGAIVVTTASILHLKGWFPISPSRWLGVRLGNAPWVFPFLTYVLPHDPTDLLHIIINMFVLWFLGRELETRLGRGRYATLFFGAALVGAIAHLVVVAATESDVPLIGASGGIFGLIFFVARETPNRPFYFYVFPIPARLLAILLLVLEIHPVLLHGVQDNVAHLCHLGGAAFGFWWCRHSFDAFRLWPRWRGVSVGQPPPPKVRSSEADDAEMDRLLAKIHAQGLGSLSSGERRFLQQRSEALRDGRR